MKFYINNEFKCFTEPSESTREFNSSFFNDKCKEFIEGYLYIPKGEVWINPENNITFMGELITPWKNSAELKRVQLEYEKQYQDAFNILLDGVVIGGTA